MPFASTLDHKASTALDQDGPKGYKASHNIAIATYSAGRLSCYPGVYALVQSPRITRRTPLNASAAGEIKPTPQNNKYRPVFLLREKSAQTTIPGCLLVPTQPAATLRPPSPYEMLAAAYPAAFPRSSTAPDKAASELAIVATLACIVLCSSLLRLFTHGRRLRTFAFDDGLALAATVSVGLFCSWERDG